MDFSFMLVGEADVYTWAPICLNHRKEYLELFHFNDSLVFLLWIASSLVGRFWIQKLNN